MRQFHKPDKKNLNDAGNEEPREEKNEPPRHEDNRTTGRARCKKKLSPGSRNCINTKNLKIVV